MQAGVPDNTRIYAVGDIHGCSGLLRALLKLIVTDDLQRHDVEIKKLIFLGDYVDRGPNSKETLDILLHELPEGFDTIFLKGNHEAILLEALEDQKKADMWLINGGIETLASYGIKKPSGDKGFTIEKQLHSFKKSLLPEHLAFLTTLQLSHQCGDYFFAHAGIDPDRSLDQQTDRDLMWIRDPFIYSNRDFGKIVVHGHTPVRDVAIKNNRIGIDTGAVYGRKLTALILEGKQREFLFVKLPL